MSVFVYLCLCDVIPGPVAMVPVAYTRQAITAVTKYKKCALGCTICAGQLLLSAVTNVALHV